MTTTQTNYDRFLETLTAQYVELFATGAYAVAAKLTPAELAEKMTRGLRATPVDASKDGEGIKRTCKILGIPQTYKAIRAYLADAPGPVPEREKPEPMTARPEHNRETVNPKRITLPQRIGEPTRVVLVYQAGICNVFHVTSFNLSDYGRDAVRIYQGDFRTGESICYGLGLAGAVVRTAACNQAGDIARAHWSEDLDSQPFSEKFHPQAWN